MQQVKVIDYRCDSIDSGCSRRTECSVAKELKERFAEWLSEVENMDGSEHTKGYLQALMDNVDAIACYPVVHVTDIVMPPRP